VLTASETSLSAWRRAHGGTEESEIREILRRLQLGERARRIARDLEVCPERIVC
jgi:plasmid stability protein